MSPANGFTEGKVRASLPRFKVESEFDFEQILPAMGMTDAFDEHRANFAGMDGRADWLYLSKVIHKAYVEVNEAGTEAAAATAAVLEFRSAPPTFRADHPFAFLIRENSTGTILFLGRIVNPVVKAV